MIGTRGHSLIELLLVVALVGVLLAMTFPTIARVRGHARDLISVSNLRTHAQVLNMYSIDWNDSFIHFTRPGADATILTACGERALYRYFMNSPMWYRPIAEEYYGSCDADPLYLPDRIDEAKDLNRSPWDYFLTAAAVAMPGYWNLDTRASRAQWGTQRLTDVRYPSSKSAFTADTIPFGHSSASLRGRVGMCMIDGSGAWFPLRSLAEPVRTGDGAFHDQWVFVDGRYGIHTPEGVLGRDLIRD